MSDRIEIEWTAVAARAQGVAASPCDEIKPPLP